jgi:O-antigen/teichoic acid export membrane protein
MGILNLSAFLVSSVQVPLLGMVLGPKIVPPFYLAQRIGQMLNTGTFQLVIPQMPLFTRELANAQRENARQRFRRTMTVASGASFFVNLFFWLGSPVIVALWLGTNRYIDNATLGLMSVDYFILGVGAFWSQFVFAAGRNPFVVTTALNAIVNVGLIFVLCPRIGLMGIPLATLTSGLITNYWYAPFKGLQLLRELRASGERT